MKEGHRCLADDGLVSLSQKTDTSVSTAVSGFYSRHVLYHFCILKDWDKLVSCIAEPLVFQNLWPGSYGIGNGNPTDALKPDVLDSEPAELVGKIAWALAEAFAERAREWQMRVFAIATAHGKALNLMNGQLAGSAASEFCNLLYGFAVFAGIAPAFALSKCQIEDDKGQIILVLRDSRFQARARDFLQKYGSIRSYVRYLAHFARNEGWSGQLEDLAWGPNLAWQKLATLAYAKQVADPQNFFKMSMMGYAKEDQAEIMSPWGAKQTKPAGVDAFIVHDELENGEKIYYMVQMDSDGYPVGYSKA